ncbi:MAG: tetratricopeptide repeat protein [bacterium]
MANSNTGRFSLKGRKNETEIEQFEALIRKRPDDDRAYVRLAELYARSGNEDKAIELYEKVAILFEKKGFLNKAKAVLKQALMINPDHGKINVLLADYDRQGGLIKDAAMKYQTAVNYYEKVGNRLAAISILRKLLEMFPGNLSFSIKLGNILVTEKMFHEAERVLVPVAEMLKGSQKVSEYANVLKLLYTATNGEVAIGRDLVNLYLRSGSYPNALAVLQKLVVDSPDSIEFLEKLAFVFEKLGDSRKLIAIYKQIATVCAKNQSFAERERLYRKILEIDPRDREALSALNEEEALRDIIVDKIDSSLAEADEGLDLVFDIDIDAEVLEEHPAEGGMPSEEAAAISDDLEAASKKDEIEEHSEDLESDLENDNIFEGIPDLPEESSSEIEEDEDMIDLADESALEEQSSLISEQSEFESIAADILSELKEPPQEQLDELEFYISIEDFSSATQLFQELLINYPESHFLNGVSEALSIKKEDDLSETVNKMKSVVESVAEEGDDQYVYDMAVSSLSMGMFKEAISLYNQILDKNENDIAALSGLAEAYVEAKKVDKAIETLNKIKEISQDEETVNSIGERINELEQSKKEKAKSKAKAKKKEK